MVVVQTIQWFNWNNESSTLTQSSKKKKRREEQREREKKRKKKTSCQSLAFDWHASSCERTCTLEAALVVKRLKDFCSLFFQDFAFRVEKIWLVARWTVVTVNFESWNLPTSVPNWNGLCCLLFVSQQEFVYTPRGNLSPLSFLVLQRKWLTF